MPHKTCIAAARQTPALWLKVGLVLVPAAFLMQLDKLVMVVLSPIIAREFNLDIQGIARVLAAMSWAYALFQIPGAWIAGRLGPMRTIGLCLVAWSSAVLMTPFAAGPVGLMVVRALMGAMQAPNLLSSLMILEREVPVRLRSRGSAALFGGGCLGTIAAGPMAATIAEHWGWRACFEVFGATGLLFGFVILGNSLACRHGTNGSETLRPVLSVGLIKTLRIGRVHALGLTHLFFLVVQSFVYVLLPVYLTSVRHTSLVETGWLASAPFVALYLAVVAGGIGSDAILKWTGSIFLARVPVGGLAMILASVCFVAGMAMASTAAMMILVCLGMAFVGIGQVVMWTAVQDVSSGVGGFVAAWVQVLGATGLGLGSLAAAKLVSLFGDWSMVAPLLLASGVGAAACLWLAQPQRPLREPRETMDLTSEATGMT